MSVGNPGLFPFSVLADQAAFARAHWAKRGKLARMAALHNPDMETLVRKFQKLGLPE